MTASDPYVIAQKNTRLRPNRAADGKLEIPGDMPGVVIFLHGVNDPGAAYQAVESGLCQGLNERLDRPDLWPGVYGADYTRAKSTPPEKWLNRERDVLDDPDTYLYQRSVDQARTRSFFIPFYWGYRAAPDEIKRDENGDPATYRTQFQDIFGNRLDRHFAKGGGFFANATNNLADMYVQGFADWYRAVPQAFLPNTLYMGQAPHRRYFVLAAHRLAMLVREIRRVSPDDTITIMGHSQGTLITLLAQALLVDRGERCADCAIMVASPYSVLPASTPKDSQTLQTLLDIVQKVTQSPHPQPPLDALVCGRPGYGGRTGPKWSAEQGQRLGTDQQTQVFPERDNRGKVYLYFSHDDTTVALRDVNGMGTFGVPDTLPDGTPAMNHLKERRFFQRLWSKRRRDGQPILLGTAPGPLALRGQDERRSAGHNWGVSVLTQAGMDEGEKRLINGEALFPPYAPQMFGAEARVGTPDVPGKDRPDAVSQHNGLGNIEARFKWVEIGTSPQRVNLDVVRAQWNQGREPDNQTQAVRQTPVSGNPMLNREDHYRIEREETANEVRARMHVDESEWDDNSYHSAVLRSPENHRWVTAMDVALGQAHCLDDPVMREVLVAIADWRMDEKRWDKLNELPGWQRLSTSSRDLVRANYLYYDKGKFPPVELVPLTPPPLVRNPYNKGTGP
ncbi:hypothetical protein AWM79_15980 [Pseudomonas agarici]|uniref:DUF3274 domain-containing protein n=1 Tax=Pseudomonas agarici TaxID=46677 RepID=A0A0X1T3T1_PSEAA|nr:DUF3274 domain-containing protein [Pseudomonas agarici]AMB86720.1 hypothetical protein AWM79_15980 [Pseudomonas agarici]